MFKLYLNDLTYDNIIACAHEYLENTVPYIRKLYAYYNGKHHIKDRVVPEGRPCNNVVVNFCRSITDNTVGYFDFQDCESQYDLSVLESVMKDTLMVGVGYCLVELDGGKPVIRRIPATKAFVIKDTTLAHNPIAACLYNEFYTYEKGFRKKNIQLFIYDSVYVQEYTGLSLDTLTLKSKAQHMIGFIPLIEARSSLNYESIYGSIIDLQDSYNLMVSSYMDGRETFSESFLLITGMTVDEDSTESLINAESKVINLPMDGADARYLVKSDSASDIKVMLDQVSDKIHSISLVPDFDKEGDYGVASGKSNSYRILSFINLVKSRENVFTQTLLDIIDPEFTWSPLMLEAESEESNTVI